MLEHEVGERDAAPAPCRDPASSSRACLGNLLHALNQPVTGLQCLFEVGLMAAPLDPAQQVRLQDGLALVERTSRIALAMRALLDIEACAETPRPLDLGDQLREVTGEFQPVAEAAEVRLECIARGRTPVTARAEQLRNSWFRALSAMLCRIDGGQVLKVSVESADAVSRVCFRWPVSVAETGSLGKGEGNADDNLDWILARAGFEREGATWQLVNGAAETLLSVVFERRKI